MKQQTEVIISPLKTAKIFLNTESDSYNINKYLLIQHPKEISPLYKQKRDSVQNYRKHSNVLKPIT